MARKLTAKEEKEATGFTPIRSKPDTLREWLEIIWSDYKMLILFGVVFLFAVIYTVRGCVGAVKPDVTVMLVSSKTVWNSEVAERLEERLAPYGFDVNGDGVVKVQVSTSCYLPEGSDDEAIQAYQEKFFTEYAAGGAFVIVGDQTVCNFLEYEEAFEPLTYFSSDLSEDLVGIRLQDTSVFDEDPLFLELLDGYRFVVRSFTKEGFDTNKLTKNEVIGARLLMEGIITSTKTKPVE